MTVLTPRPLVLSIVVPCFNESSALPETVQRLDSLLITLVNEGLIAPDSSVTYIDDGSKDETWQLIEEFGAGLARVHGIKLSRNFGHQYALLAGLLHVTGDAVVSVDADLQDDLSVIPEMVRRYVQGNEIVYGVRKSRTTDAFFKRWTAETYYRLLGAMGVNIVFNHADFRLMGRRAVDALRQFQEVNLFLRGIVPLLGFRTTTVHYERAERFAGLTKYSARKMLSLAAIGITSFSSMPLRMITIIGLIVSMFSFAFGIWVIWARIRHAAEVPGWASTVVPIYFLGGIQLLSLGVIGEYISKIYLESKARPRFLIEKSI